MGNKLFFTGLIGSGITALCCFTPLLTLLLSLAGIGGLLWLDLVLLSLLGLFLLLTGAGLWLRKQQRSH